MHYIYSTSKGNRYPIELGFKSITSNELISDYNRVIGYCQKGCKNYNYAGGCPPFAPNFELLRKIYPFGFIIYARLFSEFKPDKVKSSQKVYIHYRFQDIILSNLLTNLGYELVKRNRKPIFFLNNGYCMGCGNKKCNFKLGNKFCANPNRRTFSLEACGVDVEASLKEIFNIELQWYSESNFNTVEHMTKAIALLCIDRRQQNEIASSLVECLNNLKSTCRG
jgi:predicted metal-binding protein